MNIRIIKHKGGLYTLYSTQKIKASIDDVWDFFSKPKNLNKLTPSDLDFKITSENPNNFYEGKIISYKIKLGYFLRLNWITEITKARKNSYFIDKQLFGPYKLWHHEHHFKDNNDGTTTIIDKVKYKLYLHPFGSLIHKIFVKRNLLKIFNYREKKILGIFGD